MQKKLLDFAKELGLVLTDKSAILLLRYADLIWQKKDMLNLTSVSNKEEIVTRHICDGLAAVAFIISKTREKTNLTIADMGSGAGYIGITIAIALPQMQVSLIESLEKRCAFLNWVSMKLDLKNIRVVNIRLGQQSAGTFDVITERAMGQLNDILPLVIPSLNVEGFFVAYQSAKGGADNALLGHLDVQEKETVSYRLPCEEKERYLSVFSR